MESTQEYTDRIIECLKVRGSMHDYEISLKLDIPFDLVMNILKDKSKFSRGKRGWDQLT